MHGSTAESKVGLELCEAWGLTFDTATWNVYSVMREEVLFEYDAKIDIGASDLSIRLALNTTVTEVLETVISFEEGMAE